MEFYEPTDNCSTQHTQTACVPFERGFYVHIRSKVAALFSDSPIVRWPSPKLGIGEKVGSRSDKNFMKKWVPKPESIHEKLPPFCPLSWPISIFALTLRYFESL
jgi:hypothetical protein